MIISLTNVGHRFITQMLKTQKPEHLRGDVVCRTLIHILNSTLIVVNGEPVEKVRCLLRTGLIQLENSFDLKAVSFRYKTNPLEHVSRVVFEFTSECNFNCKHCRNGSKQKHTETDVDKLKEIADTFSFLGIRCFYFIGGEVTKFGNRWLELAKHINSSNHKMVAVITNGWWIGKTNFEAAGKFYTDTAEYLRDLKQCGVTHIVFSIDGSEKVHDDSRGCKGLFSRIRNVIPAVKEAGLNPRISMLFDDKMDEETGDALAELAMRIYGYPEDADKSGALNKLFSDSANSFSNFIDIGNGASRRRNKFSITDIPAEYLHCKTFYRPAPNLRINANGNLSVCPLLDAGEDFGNVHEKGIIEILNSFQDSFAYRLHAEKRIGEYLKYFKTEIFGEKFDHVCTIRIILTLIARQINKENTLTEEKIWEINRKVAKEAGFSNLRHDS